MNHGRRLIELTERLSSERIPALPAPLDEDRTTAESMRSVCVSDDPEADRRGWFREEDPSRSGEFSLSDVDETPVELPEDHPDRSVISLTTHALSPTPNGAPPPIAPKQSQASLFPVFLALLGLVFVVAPVGLTLGLDALAEASDPCRSDEAPLEVWETQRAALLVEQIWADPDQTSCLLAARGMVRSDFLVLMDGIAGDLTLAAEFEAARLTAGGSLQSDSGR